MNRCELCRLAVRETESVYRLAHRLTRASQVNAESLVEETYAVALQMHDRFQLDAKAVRLWLYSVLHAVLHARRVDSTGDARIDERTIPALSDAAAEILCWYELSNEDWDRMGPRLERAIDELPLRYRIVFLLWRSEELSTRQIASVIEAEEPVVLARLLRAKLAVATQLGEVATGWLTEPARDAAVVSASA